MKLSKSVRLLIAISFISLNPIHSQEIGYCLGINKLGINPSSFQPVYGMSIGGKLNSFLALETNLLYSQRSIGNSIQADYLSFVCMPKIGLFKEKFGVYYAPALVLNPTLYHSNVENHTYVSTMQGIGLEFNLSQKIKIDGKVGYDIGLSGAYFENGAYQNYSGAFVLLGMKLIICKSN
ncbi:MAG: hypothetical protein R2852_08270 [Bacteroidia bacterium]